MALVLEVPADLRVVDDPAGGRHVALLDRQDDVVLQRLVVALEQHVVGGQTGAADPEATRSDDVLHVEGDVAAAARRGGGLPGAVEGGPPPVAFGGVEPAGSG